MNLDFNPKSDAQSLSGVTLAGDSELTLEHKELHDVGSNFHWRIRIIIPASHRFSRKREVIAHSSSRSIPITISDFRDFVNNRCPSAHATTFELRCSVWLNDPYAITPKRFSDDLPFDTQSWDDKSEIYEVEKRRYERLIDGCRKFAMQRPEEMIEFELKVFLRKRVGVTGHNGSHPRKNILDFPMFNPGYSA